MANAGEWDNEGRPTLVIVLRNERPIDAAKVGRLLIDLQADYYRTTRHSLVLGHMESGSVWLYLLDAAVYGLEAFKGAGDAADGAGRIWDFGKRIKAALTRADDSSKQLPAPTSAAGAAEAASQDNLTSVIKSVERMVGTAADSNAGLEVRIEGMIAGSPSTIAVRYTPADTKRVNRQLKRDKAARKPMEKAHDELDEEVPQEVTRSLQDFSQRIDALGGTASEDDLRAVIAVVAETVKATPGGTHLLEQLAIRLDLEAKSHIAKMIREHIPPKDRTPKLTTR